MRARENCARCGAAVAGSSLCPGCQIAFVDVLEAALDLFGELDVTLSRQGRISDDDGPRMAGVPLPYSIAASDARATLLVALGGVGGPQRARRYAALSRDERRPRLDTYVRALSCVESAAEHLDEIVRAVERATAVIDRPPVLVYLGVCWSWTVVEDARGGQFPIQCPADLYAHAGAVTATCTECGTAHDAAARRVWLLELAEDRMLYASELARAVSGLGAQITSGRIYVWAHRGVIVSRGRDARNRPLYRVGDVLDALQAELTDKNKTA